MELADTKRSDEFVLWRRCRRRRAVEEHAAVFGFAGFVDGFFAADGGGEESEDGQEDEPVAHWRRL